MTATTIEPTPETLSLVHDADINEMSLRVLSTTAAILWHELEEAEGDAELEALFAKVISRIEQATAQKVDDIAWVADQLKAAVETSEFQLKKLVELHRSIIQRRQEKLERLKRYLVYLHTSGIIPVDMYGTQRGIKFQDNPAKVIPLVDPKDLPEEFKEFQIVTTTYSLDKDAIVRAWKAGKDVSAIAEIEIGKHVRFTSQTAPPRTRKVKSKR